ncbi:hypothetical protein P8G24_004701 [Salmonella enterica]|nr:hypothetical protein [Salmonella enterica]
MFLVFVCAYVYLACRMVSNKPNAKKFLIRWVVAHLVIGTFSNVGSHPETPLLMVVINSVVVIGAALAFAAVIAMFYKAFLKIRGRKS